MHPNTYNTSLSEVRFPLNSISPLTSNGSTCPIHALPPIFRRIAEELGASRVDLAIIAACTVSFITILTQSVADARWPNGQLCKVGTPALLLSPSSSGKSIVLKALQSVLARVLAELAAKAGNEDSSDLFVEDCTREALLQHLSVYRIGALITDEGGQVLQLLRHSAPAMAKLLDGADMHHARVSTGRTALRNYRFTMLLMIQADIFDSMRALLSSGKGGVGLGNRFIWSQGGKLRADACTHDVQLSPETCQKYSSLAAQLMGRALANVQGNLPRSTLKLSPAATKHLIDLPGELRTHFPALDGWAPSAEYGSRHTERTLSLAGAFHLASGAESDEIPREQVEAAAEFDRWSVSNHFSMSYVPPKLSQAEQDANGLGGALMQIAFSTGFAPIALTDLRRQAPNFGMTRGRIDRAISVLGERRQVFIALHGGKDYLHVIVPYLPAQPSWHSQSHF